MASYVFLLACQAHASCHHARLHGSSGVGIKPHSAPGNRRNWASGHAGTGTAHLAIGPSELMAVQACTTT